MESITGRILVVDDNRINRQKLSAYLQQQGHEVRLAEDGSSGLDILSKDDFDVVLLDIVMPGMDGYEVLKRMKSEKALVNIPVIVVSALDELDSAVRCIEMGAEDYLTKPFNPVLLKARLESSLRRKRLRDLEIEYHQKEIMLRQSEKMATLGRLSAGLAHELNNPAAAVQRSSQHLLEQFNRLQSANERLYGTNGLISRLLQVIDRARNNGSGLDALTRSDLEQEFSLWLEERNIPDSGEISTELVNLGLRTTDLQGLADEHPEAKPGDVFEWMTTNFSILNLVDEIHEASRRMSELVLALKTYTYLDRGPVQNVDIHEGLDNTLIMLRSRLGRGIRVHKEYHKNLPLIEAYSSELNQVWTNIIDNAVSAMKEDGDLTVYTALEDSRVVVEICDTGTGIPENVLPKIFEPFFTTKPPGEGTGLGLNISQSIIEQKHKGEISVSSVPGKTCFRVKIPLRIQKD